METRRPLLIVEDDRSLQTQMKWALSRFECVLASDRAEALAQLRQREPAVVTLDLGLPPRPDDATVGFQALGDLLALDPDVKVIVLTGQNDRANAIKAIGLGAYDFLVKPFEPEVLALTIERAYRVFELQQENRRLVEMHQGGPLGRILTCDPEMLRLMRTVEKIAPTDAKVMLLGESGTGKELFARALHELSSRKGRFVAINCAAIPEDLLESELFGYEKGAFTGAARQTPGKIESAHRGTLFLDEIGDLPLRLQPKLLRFLQERSIERVGGRESIAVDVRVVCATHRDLKDLIAQGQFREDLFYRLAEIELSIPPLRSRPGDAGLLARVIARRVAADNKRGFVALALDAVEVIEAYPWPGNVRELENVIKRAVLMVDDQTIHRAHLGLPSQTEPRAPINLRAVREAAEREAVARALSYADGNVTKAAEYLGVSRPTLYDLMSRVGAATAPRAADKE